MWLWEFSPPACGNISAESGTVLATSDGVTVDIPAGAVSSPATVAYNIAPEPGSGAEGVATAAFQIAGGETTIATGHTFQVTATYDDGTPVTAFAVPTTITILYTDSDVVYGDDSTLAVYWWDETAGAWASVATTVDTAINQATATTDKLGIFSLRAQPLNPAPIILSVSPSSGSDSLDTQITISGENFLPTPTANLDIGGLTVQYVSSTTLTATVPAQMAPGTYELILINPDGQAATLPAAFTVLSSIYLPIVLKGG